MGNTYEKFNETGVLQKKILENRAIARKLPLRLLIKANIVPFACPAQHPSL